MNKINNIGLARELLKVYDFDGFTPQEVWSRIAQKINIIIEHFNYLDNKFDNQKELVDSKLNYLLNEGLTEQVSKKIITLINDGTIGELINGTLLKEINDKVDTFKNEINEQLNTIAYNIENYKTTLNTWNDAFDLVITLMNEGDTLRFPSGYYEITREFIVDKKINIIGNKKSTVIEQKTWGCPVFKVEQDKTIISNIMFINKQIQTTSNYTDYGLGRPKRDFNSAIVLFKTSNCEVFDIVVNGYHNAISVVGNGASDSPVLRRKNKIHDIEFENCAFGVLLDSQCDMELYNIFGSYKIIEETAPPHLIYCTWGGVYSQNLNINNFHAFNSSGSTAFQFKFVKHLKVNNLFADNTQGLLSLKGVSYAEFNNLQGIDLFGDNQQGIYIINSDSDVESKTHNITFNNVKLHGVNSEVMCLDSLSHDIVFNNLEISNLNTNNLTTTVMKVIGSYNIVNNLIIKITGVRRNGIEFLNGNNCLLNGYTCRNTKSPLYLNTTDSIAKYDYKLIESDSRPTITSTSQIVCFDLSRKLIPQDSSNWVQIELGLFNIGTIEATNNNIIQLWLGGSATEGNEVAFILKNTSGGTLNNVSWQFQPKLSGSFVLPDNTKSSYIRFKYLNGSWVEIFKRENY